MSVTRYVSATQGLNPATGAAIPPAAGATVVADGAGGATWGAAAAAPLALTVYVSTTGNDANNGATPLTAVATIAAAIAIVQQRGWKVSAAIRLLPGGYTMAGGSVIRGDGAPGARTQLLTIQGDSVTTLGAFNVLAAAVVNNLASVTLAAPVPLAADGQRARFTSGALAGQQFVVGNIVGAAFTLMSTAAPAPGDAFVFEATNATVTAANGILFSGGPRVLQDLTVVLPDPTTAVPPALLLLDTSLILSGARFEMGGPGGVIVVVESTLSAGAGNMGIPGTPPNPLGMFAQGAGGPSLNLLFLGSSFVSLGNSYIRDATVQTSAGASLLLNASLTQRCVLSGGAGGHWNSSDCQYVDGQSDGLNLEGASASLSRVDISNAAGSGIRVTSSDLRLEPPITSAVANADSGIRIGPQGRVAVSNNATGVTLSGVGNPDVIVGVNAPSSWADLIAGIAARTDFVAPLTTVSSIAIS